MCGSQVVGLVPLQSLMDAAEYYMQRDNLFILDEDQKLRLAIDKLGLSSLGLFNPKQRIIELVSEIFSYQDKYDYIKINMTVTNAHGRLYILYRRTIGLIYGRNITNYLKIKIY